MNTILDRVKEECKKKGVSVRKMASDLGMSYNSLYKWKESVPDSSSVLKVLSMAELLTGKKEDKK